MKILLFVLFIGCTLLSCNKESEYDKLPPITTAGENTFACLINGKYWSKFDPLINQGISASLSSTSVSVSASRSNETIRIGLLIDSIPEWTLEVPKIYELEDRTCRIANFTDINYILYETNIVKGCIGEVEFLRIDTLNKVIAGTFWFDAINASGEIVEIRHGRFIINRINYYHEYKK